MKRYVRNILSCLWVASAFAILLYAPGVLIYYNNTDQFNAGPAFLLGVFVAVTALTAFGLAALLAIFHGKWPQETQAFGIATCVKVFLQYNFWSKFFLSYNNVYFRISWDFIFQALTLLVLLAIPFLLAWRFRKAIAGNAVRLSLVILLSQLAVIANATIRYKAPAYDFKDYTFSQEEKFSFGQDENIIILVVDCMGEGICKEVLEKYPELKDSLKDFTCFDRMISPLPWTMYALPAMMTGVNFPRKAYRIPGDDNHSEYLTRVCKSETSLFRTLRSKGFRIEGYPYLLPTISYSPDVLDNSIPQYLTRKKASIFKIGEMLCRKHLPFFLECMLPPVDYVPFLVVKEGKIINGREHYDQEFYRRLKNEICIGEKPYVFKYLHLQGAHETVNTDENLDNVHTTLKYKQLRGSLRNFELLVKKLKALGLYDNATILMVGDHTECYEIQNIAFIKRKNEHHYALTYNSVPCQISDIAGTVMKEYGIATDLPSLYDMPAVPGDGTVRPEQARYADFRPWQPCEKAPDDGSYGNNCRMLIDNGMLIFENFIDAREISVGTEVRVLLEQVGGNGKWLAKLDYSQRYACLRTKLDSFPDGEYKVTLYFKGPGETGQIQNFHTYALSNLHISQGQARLEEYRPALIIKSKPQL